MQGLAGFNLLTSWAFKARQTDTAAHGFAIYVPFEFVLGTLSLPAGTYQFEVSRSMTPGVCVLAARGEDGRLQRVATSVSSNRAHRHCRSKLVFQLRDHCHFLTEAWLDGTCLSLQLYRSLQDFDLEQDGRETEVILLLEPDNYGRAVYVIEACGCTA